MTGQKGLRCGGGGGVKGAGDTGGGDGVGEDSKTRL